MKKTTLALAIAALASGGAFANGLGEDRAWQFQSHGAKYVMLQSRLAEEKLDADGFGPGNTTITLGDGSTFQVGDAVAGDKIDQSSSNCINCVSSSVTVGDNLSGSVAVGEVAQTSDNAQQANVRSEAGNDSTVSQN